MKCTVTECTPKGKKDTFTVEIKDNTMAPQVEDEPCVCKPGPIICCHQAALAFIASILFGKGKKNGTKSCKR